MKARLFLILAAVLLGGCAAQQYRLGTTVCDEATSPKDACLDAIVANLDTQNNGRASMAVIEFDESGNPFNKDQEKMVLDHVKSLSDQAQKNGRGLLMIVFIHGWNHNAAPDDSNVASFRKFLRAVAADEGTLKVGQPRDVVGIYVGWQGDAGGGKLQKLLSYREKKELGLKTGFVGVTGILTELRDIRGKDVPENKNRLVLVGHSFGGGVLFSAIRDDLLLDWSQPHVENPVYGDLSILVNPAVEAGQFLGLDHALQTRDKKCGKLKMASFTSETDTDLSGLFNTGMKFFYRGELDRYGNRDLMTQPVGVYLDYVQFDMRLVPGANLGAPVSKEAFTRAAADWYKFRESGDLLHFPDVELKARPDVSKKALKWPPVVNVRVPSEVISDHNGIWEPGFSNFLRYFIGLEFAKGQSTSCDEIASDKAKKKAER